MFDAQEIAAKITKGRTVTLRVAQPSIFLLGSGHRRIVEVVE